jgi:hypothetical protein
VATSRTMGTLVGWSLDEGTLLSGMRSALSQPSSTRDLTNHEAEAWV